jgi:choline monooxygenase
MFNLANIQAPIETANGLPNACYIDPSVHQHEQNTLFCDKWVALGFEKGIPQPSYITSQFSRASDAFGSKSGNNINVFQNVRRHRSMKFVDTAKRLRGKTSDK